MTPKKKVTAGYSGTPLARKLGLKASGSIVALGAPDDYAQLLDPLPDGARIEEALADGSSLVHWFGTSRDVLASALPGMRDALDRAGALWISWPKKAAKVPTDLDREVVRELGLAAGLVDVKVCAVDATWSALKFVFRVADR